MKKRDKSYRNDRKAVQVMAAGRKDPGTLMQRYQLKQEQDIEKVLSPFWAWRAMNG